ncbi:MAG: TIGR04372 family glycosyltransferase [SAR202 cluster bacterium]|nr:TIGR04372 family glycosyltransferase [SAR202 cluster bacterium]
MYVGYKHLKLVFKKPLTLPLVILAFPVVVAIRLIRPWLLIRWGRTYSSRIGHFAGNTEQYLCEQDAGINSPRQRHVDFISISRPISNQQLAKMWRRTLHLWPDWLQAAINRANWLIPGGAVHRIGQNTSQDRDVHNLLDRFPPHLIFTAEEEARGVAGLRLMGIPADIPFVCLISRDSAYLDAQSPRDWSYHNHRDSDIQNYVLATEELANRGYFVVRMGAQVREAIKSRHPKVIDYATNGMRSDFMDVYLGAKCAFCISGTAGFEAVPLVFRRPIVFVNVSSLGYIWTSRNQFVVITKRHYSLTKDRELTVKEIFSFGSGFSLASSEYESKGIQLIENTPEEIRDAVIELVERLSGTWQPQEDDEALQGKFWEIFPADAKTAEGEPLHGEIRSHFGAEFLRNNRDWLQ